MSKIPQGEWSAIAARYAKGESISRIAQSYGCTPPAIHYILKRYGHRAAQNLEQAPNALPSREPTQESINPEISGPPGPQPAIQAQLQAGRDRDIGALPSDRTTPPAQQRFNGARGGKGGSALTAGLDSDLHGRAEAAIAAFRSSFDAALAEGSPYDRQRLRQAASDLMRVAARTTIVLDRLNAAGERGSARAEDRLV